MREVRNIEPELFERGNRSDLLIEPPEANGVIINIDVNYLGKLYRLRYKGYRQDEYGHWIPLLGETVML